MLYFFISSFFSASQNKNKHAYLGYDFIEIEDV